MALNPCGGHTLGSSIAVATPTSISEGTACDRRESSDWLPAPRCASAAGSPDAPNSLECRPSRAGPPPFWSSVARRPSVLRLETGGVTLSHITVKKPTDMLQNKRQLAHFHPSGKGRFPRSRVAELPSAQRPRPRWRHSVDNRQPHCTLDGVVHSEHGPMQACALWRRSITPVGHRNRRPGIQL
jgi:hypothetical protein